MADQTADSEISDLAEPENEFERSYGQLLEVYAGVRVDDRRADAVRGVLPLRQRGRRPGRRSGAGSPRRRSAGCWSCNSSRSRSRSRWHGDCSVSSGTAQRLLQQAVDASDAERRRMAADLHDGVVQELTGLTYSLDAARLGPPDPERDAELIASAATNCARRTGRPAVVAGGHLPAQPGRGGTAGVADRTGQRPRARRADRRPRRRPDGRSAADAVGGAVPLGAGGAAQHRRHSDARHVDVQATVATDGPAWWSTTTDADSPPRTWRTGWPRATSGCDRSATWSPRAGGQLTVRSAPGQGTRAEIMVPMR